MSALETNQICPVFLWGRMEARPRRELGGARVLWSPKKKVVQEQRQVRAFK